MRNSWQKLACGFRTSRTAIVLAMSFIVFSALTFTAVLAALPGGIAFFEEGIIVYPGPNAVVKSDRPVIGADFKNMPDQSIWYEPRLFVDGVDVTEQSDVNRGYVFYKPPVALEMGTRIVELKLSAAAQERQASSSDTKEHRGARLRHRSELRQIE